MFFLTWKTSVVATSKKNASVSLVFSFLYKIVQVGSQPPRPSTPFLSLKSLILSKQ